MKYKVAFLCVHNSARSQMAEAFANKLASDLFECYSAGTEEYPEVKPLAIEAMEEISISMTDHFPKLLTDIPQNIDIVIIMGCEANCPFFTTKLEEDWGLDDPTGGTIDDFRLTRDLIENKVKELTRRIENNMI